MSLDTSDATFVTGLHTEWRGGSLVLQPRMPDPRAAHCYDELDNFPAKPWNSWAPRKQFLTTITGLLCRAWYFSTSRQSRVDAFWEVFVCLVLRAGFPWPVVCSRAASGQYDGCQKGMS